MGMSSLRVQAKTLLATDKHGFTQIEPRVLLIGVHPCSSVAKFVSARWLSLIPRRLQNSGHLRRSESRRGRLALARFLRSRAGIGWSNVSNERDRSLTGCPLGPVLSKRAWRARPRGHPMSKRLGLNAQVIPPRLLSACQRITNSIAASRSLTGRPYGAGSECTSER